ncbi:hypothetical protein FQB35_06535 [Crassaminicella thermophila]|uniref:Peptidase MA superfamily protein n=1 Tax=Crassaminicella thermophila TaxID=2599308 RepID=A0A5C0SE63_CRATE|nr:hypothetical protein [Crassaminicella thermophila]QEK12056.1 hypothetical protein FQB35_06535 [Crassaminicella thermophila]
MKKILIIVFILFIIMVIQSLPIIILKDIGMKKIHGNYVNVYYDKGDDKGGRIVFKELENSAKEIGNKLNYKFDSKIVIYVYKNQSLLHIRKYGLATLAIAPDWYIGDNKGSVVLMVSPQANVKGHNIKSIMSAAKHELVHVINYRINPNLSYFIDNGVATYLSKQSPYKNFIQYNRIPSIEFLEIKDELKFGNAGGYQYSYTFIEFLDKKYGWESVFELIKGNKFYVEIFSKTKQEIYNEWVKYLKEYY